MLMIAGNGRAGGVFYEIFYKSRLSPLKFAPACAKIKMRHKLNIAPLRYESGIFVSLYPHWG